MGNGNSDVNTDKGGRYQRSTVLIDKRFQFRYLALIAGTAALIMVILGLMYAGVLSDQRDLIGIQALSTRTEMSADDARFDREMNAMAENEDDIKLLILFSSALVLVGVLSWVAVRMTFRVVGPIKAASAMLRGIRSGDDTAIRHFRKGDEFRFLAQDIIDLRDSMRERESGMRKMLSDASAEIRRCGGDKAVADNIDRLLADVADVTPGDGRED
jgi:methyl-accepting chemotaxis protein